MCNWTGCVSDCIYAGWRGKVYVHMTDPGRRGGGLNVSTSICDNIDATKKNGKGIKKRTRIKGQEMQMQMWECKKCRKTKQEKEVKRKRNHGGGHEHDRRNA